MATDQDCQPAWLYALVFRNIGKWDRPVLIEEHKNEDHALFPGTGREEPIGAWLRDADGLNRLNAHEYEIYRTMYDGTNGLVPPCVLFTFWIAPRQDRVVSSLVPLRRGGGGNGYVVKGYGESAESERDPNCGAWIG